MAIEELRQDPMMTHLISSLEQGRDIRHYGRLVFVMIARHFLSEDELLQYLMKDRQVHERQARSLLAQVNARDYNPPKRERVLEWMSKQDFPICPDPNDPDQCNVYKIWIFRKRSTTGSENTTRAKQRITLESGQPLASSSVP